MSGCRRRYHRNGHKCWTVRDFVYQASYCLRRGRHSAGFRHNCCLSKRYFGHADVLTGDNIAVFAIYAVIGGVVVDGRAALVLSCMWPLEDRQNFSGPSRRGTLPPLYRFGSCEVDFLLVARSVVVVHRGPRRFLFHRQETYVHHACPAVTHSGG